MTGLKTFCDTDGNTVGYAISAITSSIDPDTCVPSFGLQAEYYDTDFNVLGSSLPAGWGECCCGGSETVTTLTEDALNRTATYTNEIGAMTVLSETDFTANSQIIPGTCEGVLADANVLRELPVRWDTGTNTYKAYDDGKTTQVMATQNGSITSQVGLVPTGSNQLSTISSLIINNPSTCKPLQIMVAPWIQGDVTNGSGSNWFYADHLLYYGFNVPPVLDSRVATTVGTFTPIGGAIEKKQSITDRRLHLETIPAGGSGTINYRCGHEIKQGSNIASVVTISSIAVWGVIA